LVVGGKAGFVLVLHMGAVGTVVPGTAAAVAVEASAELARVVVELDAD
jgi:hypothetical protein